MSIKPSYIFPTPISCLDFLNHITPHLSNQSPAPFLAPRGASGFYYLMSTYATTAFISAYRIRVVVSAFRHQNRVVIPCFGHTALSLSQQFGYFVHQGCILRSYSRCVSGHIYTGLGICHRCNCRQRRKNRRHCISRFN